MNPGRHKLWWAFWGGVVLVVMALGWASLAVHSLEERNAIARAENQRQEIIRLALWRMDSRLAPMIALEAARPVEDYEAVLGLPDMTMGFSSSRNAGVAGKKQVEPGAFSRGFFEFDELGQAKGSGEQAKNLASKVQRQSSTGSGETDDAIHSSAVEKNRRRETESARSDQQTTAAGEAESPVLATTPKSEQEPGAIAERETKADYAARQQIAEIVNSPQSNRMLYQFASESKAKGDDLGLEMFADSVSEQNEEMLIDADGQRYYNESLPSAVIGAIEPRWVVAQDGSSELVLVRTIQRDGLLVVQGVWLDWMAMSAELLESINDLLPGSTLYPIGQEPRAKGKNETVTSYRLATVPVSFIPGGSYSVDRGSLTPAMLAMLVTWIAVILAMVAVGVVLNTVLTLSARRGRFVGAVTHELRTPLTTFRLYSQMLADGMVTDEAVQKEYLNTLKRESDRLTGIVENVLEYARISRQRGVKDTPKGQQQLTVGELMAWIVPPMSRLGEQAGMDLIVSDETGEHVERTVTLDPHAIERIVMNLMDNACKYAGADGESSEEVDLRVHLDASVSGDSLLLVVADHGPGVPSRDRRKIFGEFVRGSSGTMRDRSGLGLGLALSRGLAIEMGGDLSLVRRRGHGAEFELRVPLDAEAIKQD